MSSDGVSICLILVILIRPTCVAPRRAHQIVAIKMESTKLNAINTLHRPMWRVMRCSSMLFRKSCHTLLLQKLLGHQMLCVEHTQASILAQDWFGQSPNNYGSGHEGGAGESEDMESSSSCSSTGERPYDGEDWITNLDSDEFSALYGEVGMRFNQMVPIPHVPRINGDIPSVDEAISDHQRLLDRLQVYNLGELKVEGDGNCQFWALSDQFYRSPEHHKFVRQQVVNQLKSYPEMYEGYVPMAYGDYLKKISSTGEWGDHVTLQAAADSYGIKISVVTSFKDTCYIEILPNVQKSKRKMPVFEETKKKNKWWNFRNKH